MPDRASYRRVIKLLLYCTEKIWPLAIVKGEKQGFLKKCCCFDLRSDSI